MKKWKCINEECTGRCEINTEHVPFYCIDYEYDCAEWEEVTEEPEHKQDEPVTDCNQLPGWCTVDEYVWCDRNGYGKIHSVREDRKLCAVYFKNGGGAFPLKAFLKFKQARLRPWMPEEAIGKVVVTDENYYIISAADKYTALIGNTFIKMDELLNRFKQPDGLLCGVLEHLEDGEWVGKMSTDNVNTYGDLSWLKKLMENKENKTETKVSKRKLRAKYTGTKEGFENLKKARGTK